MTMDTATRWPLDYEKLSKGDSIPADRLAQIIGLPQSHRDFAFKLMQLRQNIESTMRKLGRPVTTRVENGSIKVLSDADASQHNHRRLHLHRRGLLRRHHQNMEVDVSALDDTQRQQHDRFIETDGRYVQAIRDTGSQLRLAACKRDVPGLPAM